MTTAYLKHCIALLVVLLSATCSHSQEHKIEKEFRSQSGDKIKYAYSLPSNFKADIAYHILLAPGGGTADDSNDFLFWGPKTEAYDWILVETDAGIRPNNMVAIKEFLEHLRLQLKPAANKFHIMGFSANSAGTFKLALALPEYFHSVTAVPGHPRTNDKKELLKLRTMKVNFIVGENDSYWLSSANKFNTQLKGLGVDVKLKIVKNGGHVLGEIIGDRFMNYMEWTKK